MKDTQLARSMAILAVVLALAAGGCTTATCPKASCIGTSASEPGPCPPVPFCSPFLACGGLTPWAAVGIERGLGLEFNPVLDNEPAARPFMDARGLRCSRRPKYAVSDHSKLVLRRTSNLAARQVGGWDTIEESSDTRYGSAEDLALGLYTDNSGHPRFAEALAAAMAVYPSLREEYYQATTAGRRFWYQSKTVRCAAPSSEEQ